jgi:hypothetical protein
MVLLTLAVGCGGPAEKVVSVRGKVVRGGAPLKLKGDPKLPLPPGDPGASISFVHVEGPKIGQDEPGTFNPDDGSFHMIGVEGKGIPPGRYKVVVRIGGGGQPDSLKDKHSRENSKLEVTVPDTGVQDLVIDLDKK